MGLFELPGVVGGFSVLVGELAGKDWGYTVSGGEKEGGMMKNLYCKVDDEIIEVEMIVVLWWVVCVVGGVRWEMVDGGW